jgi:transposase
MTTQTYLTNLSDAEWARLEPLLPAAHTGHPRHHSLRTIVNALLDVLLDVLRTGCAWRLLALAGACCPSTGLPGKVCTIT